MNLSAGSLLLSAESITAGYEGETIVNAVTASFKPGSFTAIIGPNGSGKSTFMLCLARQLPFQGTLKLNGKDTRSMPRKTFAQQVAFLPQNPIAPESITVNSLIERGRTPYRKTFFPLTQHDRARVSESLHRVGLEDYKDNLLAELSGGQRQRAWLAFILAQDSPVVILDEPTSYLDLSHQTSILKMCQEFSKAGKTVISVLHDLNLAAAAADEMVVFSSGQIVRGGDPSNVISNDLLVEVFGLDASIIKSPSTAKPVILPSF